MLHERVHPSPRNGLKLLELCFPIPNNSEAYPSSRVKKNVFESWNPTPLSSWSCDGQDLTSNPLPAGQWGGLADLTTFE